jgi:hypothetical protein
MSLTPQRRHPVLKRRAALKPGIPRPSLRLPKGTVAAAEAEAVEAAEDLDLP